ncbi:ATPase [Massilioclostridium coli]|uniref:ATPase n=1 Tax=Massilioclostridium coli TaxID=1870991 RepID=UPI00085BE389|nr:ATPase [Massilioclostridium coli]
MNINEILDTMEDMLEQAWSLPLSGGKSVVNVERMLDLISEIHLQLPKEIKQSKMIVADRQDIINDAKKEAEQIIRDAELKAKRLVSDTEILKEAKTRANQMLTQAHNQSNEIKQMTNEYVERVLTKSEETLLTNLQELKGAHAAIRKSSK